MNAIVKAGLIASLLATPLFAFAQSTNAPLTRAQVRADLVRLENAGYRPEADDATYPADIQAAEAKVAASDDTLAKSAVGGTPEVGGAQSGGATNPSAGDSQSTYEGQ